MSCAAAAYIHVYMYTYTYILFRNSTYCYRCFCGCCVRRLCCYCCCAACSRTCVCVCCMCIRMCVCMCVCVLIFTNLKKRFEHIELPAKLLDYFLRSNNSNINQCVRVARSGKLLKQQEFCIYVYVYVCVWRAAANISNSRNSTM